MPGADCKPTEDHHGREACSPTPSTQGGSLPYTGLTPDYADNTKINVASMLRNGRVMSLNDLEMLQILQAGALARGDHGSRPSNGDGSPIAAVKHTGSTRGVHRGNIFASTSSLYASATSLTWTGITAKKFSGTSPGFHTPPQLLRVLPSGVIPF